jgi:hypothetical protein
MGRWVTDLGVGFPGDAVHRHTNFRESEIELGGFHRCGFRT